nr:follistatin-related protein 1 [Cavia porcellus]
MDGDRGAGGSGGRGDRRAGSGRAGRALSWGPGPGAAPQAPERCLHLEETEEQGLFRVCLLQGKVIPKCRGSLVAARTPTHCPVHIYVEIQLHKVSLCSFASLIRDKIHFLKLGLKGSQGTSIETSQKAGEWIYEYEKLRAPSLAEVSPPTRGVGALRSAVEAHLGHHPLPHFILPLPHPDPLTILSKEEIRSKSKVCANVFCGAGRECAVTEKGEPTCLCIEQCKPHKRPVCGSNGKTYLNHCELHRDACLTGSKIQVDYDGHCKEKKSVSPSASPVVCYQANRDELRRRIIQWLEAEIIPDGWFSKGSNYSEILDKYFKHFDNGDSRLDSSEFLKFVEQNETAINITTYADQENNKLLRGLCVDALIELSDENADWKLSFQEFLKCLNPSFNPPEKKCALEDETYADGAETEVDCNRCVCACGNWVCTALTCDGKNQKGAQTQTEEEMTRYVQELQKHQDTAVKTKRVSAKEV